MAQISVDNKTSIKNLKMRKGGALRSSLHEFQSKGGLGDDFVE